MAGNYFDQVSEKEVEWLKLKWANFSASKIHNLTKTGSRPMTEAELKLRAKGDQKKTVPTLWGDAAITYIEEVATQAVTIFNMQQAFENRAMRNGKINEPISFVQLQNYLGVKEGVMSYHGGEDPIFVKYTEDSGCSPDVTAKKKNGTYSFGAELKNPDAKTHFRYLREVRTQQQLMIEEPLYYGQCQMAMMTFKCDLWLWCSHCEYMKNYADRLHVIRVLPDKPYITRLDMRLKLASAYKNTLITQLDKLR